ncbi:hypothetical protein ACFOED_10130 [Vulcaniibacterium thermophilum]|jgi:signal transduction histidine kinase|uniref:Uncharacterized protein n=1 Tax=Vulcaniibacterium thermophilum TaxID=1169913 RepID=A0A918ZAP1_9GAMM|nr:hypothetical protein [Vulcaniibacterium thermophilum]GHE43492.1 hypothetical protein GCM10007167_26570 [Vulcaniibacterium thermophilum]
MSTAPDLSGQGARADWLHRLRNELNTIGLAAAAAQLLMERGDRVGTQDNLKRVRDACTRCARLLDEPPV